MPRIRTKLRSLMTRVLRRCGLDEQSVGRRRLNARRAAYIQPLESRQMLSVAIEMVVNPTGSPSAYVVDGSDVYASQADSFSIDFYVTSNEGTPNNTLYSFDLNLTGTDTDIILDEWLRNTALFPNTAGDVFNFSDDTVDDAASDYFVSAATVGLDDRDTLDKTDAGDFSGWYIGSLELTLPSTVGDYVLTFTSTADDQPSLITHTVTDGVVETSSPDVNALTFHVVEAATLSIEDLPDLTGDADIASTFGSIDITTTNVDGAELSLSDFTLVHVVNGVETIVISDLDNDTNTDNDWEDFAGISLVDAGGGVYQITGLDDVIELADGDYTLTAVAAGIMNNAGVPLIADAEELFEVDSAVPQVTVNDQTTNDRTPTITGTVIDQTLDTMSITISHANDLTFASQTFTLANGDFTIDGNGNWTLDGSKLSALEGGTYDVRVVAVDEVGQTTDETYEDKLLIVDAYENDDSDSDAPSNLVDGSRHYNLSIHESGDVDWKSFVLGADADVLVLGNVISGDEITVNYYLYNSVNDSIPQTPNYTFTSASGTLSQTISGMTAGTYYIEISSTGDGNSDGTAGVVYNYNFVTGIEADLSNSISGSIYVDENFDGAYNAGDGDALDLTAWNGGLGVLVELYAMNDLDNPVDSVYSTDGSYTFSNVISDTYRVRIQLPDGTFQTTSNPADILLDGAVDETNVDFGLRDVEVADEYLFYNNSVYDGNNASANSNDDNAIDTSKQALHQGETATSVNITANEDGVNGIMFDVIGLQTGSLSAGDFSFKMGNDNTPDDDWTAAPTPASITIREGEGVNGSDRVTIIWSDGDIADTWLEVKVLAGGSVGLAEDWAFYFGNNIGDVNFSEFVGIDDVFDIWNNRATSSGPQQATSYIYDLNKDGFADIQDVFVAWNNRKSSATYAGLQKITPVSGSPMMLAEGESTDADTQAVSQSEVQQMLAYAITNWQATLADTGLVWAADQVQVQVVDLGGQYLGLASGSTIYIDDDAAGAGWFIDTTPNLSEEYTWSEQQQTWIALPNTQASQGVDLLTVLTHEIGHTLGLEDVADDAQSSEPDSIMTDTLAIGVRRTVQTPDRTTLEALAINSLNGVGESRLPQWLLKNYQLQVVD